MSEAEEQQQKPVGNIRRAAWRQFKQSRSAKIAGVIAIGLPVLALFVWPGVFIHSIIGGAAIAFGWYGSVASKIRRTFWLQTAREWGWEYIGSTPLSEEEALFLHEGHSISTTNMIKGAIEDVEARAFESEFTIGHGKHSETYHYTVFGFRFGGRFPHLYLNRYNNGYDITGEGVEISLPAEFEKMFTLYAPPEYEVEALQIFTGDVLSHLLDMEWPHDIELVDRELLIFRNDRVNTREELEEEFERAKKLMRYFAPKLERMRFERIGDQPYILSD